MKDFLYVLLAIAMVALAIIIVVGQVVQIGDIIISFAERIGRGSIVFGLIATPFTIIGCIRFVKGAFLLIEQDSKKYHLTDWQIMLYGAINLLGYVALALLVGTI